MHLLMFLPQKKKQQKFQPAWNKILLLKNKRGTDIIVSAPLSLSYILFELAKVSV